MTTPKAEGEAGTAVDRAYHNLEYGDEFTAADLRAILNENAALLARAEAAERKLSVASHNAEKFGHEVVLLEAEITTAQASIGAAWCEGYEAGHEQGQNPCACHECLDAASPPPDAAAALQRAKDALLAPHWEVAALAKSLIEQDGLEGKAGWDALWSAIVALRKEG